MIVISDTSAITNLAAIDQLTLLPLLLGIRITGLLGILVEAKRKALIVAVKPLMDTLIATSEFRVSSALYSRILEIVGEV